MLQLMIERPNINFKTLKAGQKSLLRTPQPISKTPHIMQLLGQRFSRERGGISPTAISNYLRCQLRFFYRYVCELQEPNDDTNSSTTASSATSSTRPRRTSTSASGASASQPRCSTIS